MSTTIDQLGNGDGYIYETNQSGVLTGWRRNTKDGIRDMRQKAAVNSPIAASRSGHAVIKVVSVASAGAFTNVDISAVNQIAANVNVLTSDPATEAARLAAAINTFTPASGPNFKAQVINESIYVIEPQSAAGQYNGVLPSISVTDVSIQTTVTAFQDGATPAGASDGQFGRDYYLNADPAAEPQDITGALLITKYITVRSASAGIPALEYEVASDQISSIDRYNSIIGIQIDSEGGSGDDYLVTLGTIDMVQNDIVMLYGKDSGRSVTIVSQPNASSVSSAPVPNIYLSNDADFSTNGPLGRTLFLKYSYTDSLGPHWIELTRTTGGSGCITALTWSEANTLKGNSALNQGCKYLITNGAGGTTPVIVSASAADDFELDAEGIYLNADYQGAGDYSGVSGFGSQLGIWNASMAVPTPGDVAIWDGVHYKSLNATVGSQPDGDPTNWQSLPKAVTNGYIQETDTIKYKFSFNQVNARYDRRGNIIEGDANVIAFDWGNDKCYNNMVLSEATFSQRNVLGEFKGNNIYGGTFSDNVIGASSTIDNNTVYSGEVVSNILTGTDTFSGNIVLGGSIADNTSGSGKSIGIADNIVYIGSQIKNHNDNINIADNELFGDSTIDANVTTTGTGNITNNRLQGQNGLFNTGSSWGKVTPSAYDISNRKCRISGNTLGNGNSHISGNYLGPNAEIQGNVIASTTGVYSNNLRRVGITSCIINDNVGENDIEIGLVSVTVGDEIYRKEQSVDKNTISYASFAGGGIDITGLSTITVPSGHLKQVGIIPLGSGNPTETVDTVSGMDGKTTRVKFMPESGLTVTFNQTAAPGAAGKFVMPAASYAINGTNGDYIEFEVRNQIFYYLSHRIAT